MDATRTGPGLALGAAVLFGLSAPAAKLLVGRVDPWLLAGLLYLGSGMGLGLWRLSKGLLGHVTPEAPLGRRDLRRLAAAIAVGGVIGPVLLTYGLAGGTAVQSSLLLNLEGVFTALLAWSFFREHFDARIGIGMASIATGAVALSWNPSGALALDMSALLVIGACLAWAIDNNLTRMVSGGDPVQIATLKGLVAGSINVLLAVVQQASWPTPATILGASVVGFLGYGTSLVFFVLALRLLGTARTGAYFSTAPFVGAVAGAVALHEPLTWQALLAAVLMGAGVWLHLTERHDHEHQHDTLEHMHAHVHDEHHQHVHEPGTPSGEPHSHLHVHASLRHRHPHFPDLHHRHHH
ncbi:MAG TPA: EamA family transporter [Gemmatimonadales bacterium]|nr:EamA family transporter [Gemmatimonadales bacterium]